MDEKTRELVGIAAAIAAHCRHCFVTHFTRAKQLEISAEEIKEAAELAMSCSRSGSSSACTARDGRILSITSRSSRSSTDPSPPAFSEFEGSPIRSPAWDISLYQGLNTRVLRTAAIWLYRISLPRTYVIFENPEDRDIFIHRRFLKAGQTHLIMGTGVDVDKFQPGPKTNEVPVVL